MGGLRSAGGGFTIVEGAGLPRLDRGRFQPARRLADPGRTPGGGQQGRCQAGVRIVARPDRFFVITRRKHMRRWLGMPVARRAAADRLRHHQCLLPGRRSQGSGQGIRRQGDRRRCPIRRRQASRQTPSRAAACAARFDRSLTARSASRRRMRRAQPDITIKTPAIQAIQARMASRFDGTLRPHFDSGALGFTSDGLIAVRDASKIAAEDRVAVNQAVADDNPRPQGGVSRSRRGQQPSGMGRADPRRCSPSSGSPARTGRLVVPGCGRELGSRSNDAFPAPPSRWRWPQRRMRAGESRRT